MGKIPINLQSKLFYHPDRISDLLENNKTTPITWEFDLTNICNHNCIGCNAPNAGGRTDENSLTFNEATNYIDQIYELNAKAINLTGGGEPFSNDITPKIIKYIKNIGLEVSIITNGTLLTDEIIDTIVKNCTWIRISIDGGDVETYTNIRRISNNYFNLVFDNLKKLTIRKKELNSNITIGSSFLTNKITIPSLLKYAKLCKDVDIDYIQIRPFHRDYTIPYNIDEVKKLQDDNFKIYYSENKYDKTYKKEYNKCIAHNLSGVINVHSVYLCCHFRGIESKKLGDLRHDNLLKIWTGDRKRIIENELDVGKCLPHCRLDLVNRTLNDLIYNQPQHKNFI